MSDTPSGNGPPPSARQGDLFEDLEPSVDAGFATAERIALDETSWIEYVPRWLQGSASLFDELTATASGNSATATCTGGASPSPA